MLRKIEKLILLDRDGTLIRHVHHIVDPNLVELMAGAGVALARLAENGYEFAVVTNQSVIGRGMTTRANVDKINDVMRSKFAFYGFNFLDVLICPHLPLENCECRKPNTKLGEELLARFQINRSKVWMIGDQESDILFGMNLGVKCLFLNEIGRILPKNVPHFLSWPQMSSHILKSESLED